MSHARITVTLPQGLMEEIDRRERNRSRFVQEAVRRELERRRREELLESAGNPHPQAEEVAEAGLGEWADRASPDDEGLLDAAEGTAVEWSPERGWAPTDP